MDADARDIIRRLEARIRELEQVVLDRRQSLRQAPHQSALVKLVRRIESAPNKFDAQIVTGRATVDRSTKFEMPAGMTEPSDDEFDVCVAVYLPGEGEETHLFDFTEGEPQYVLGLCVGRTEVTVEGGSRSGGIPIIAFGGGAGSIPKPTRKYQVPVAIDDVGNWVWEDERFGPVS